MAIRKHLASLTTAAFALCAVASDYTWTDGGSYTLGEGDTLTIAGSGTSDKITMSDGPPLADFSRGLKADSVQALRFPGDWRKVKRAIDKFGDRLPHMPCFGEDFVWCDPENAVVAVKRGSEMLFVEAYWRARGGVNNLAKVRPLRTLHRRHQRLSSWQELRTRRAQWRLDCADA